MLKICIIGGGPGGYAAAFMAAQNGCEVSLVENVRLGGTCLNAGCVPTKALKASADALETVKHLSSYGLKINEGAEPIVDIKAVLARKNKIRDILEGGLTKTCAKHKISYYNGFGKIINPHQVQVQTESETIDLNCDYIIIATGSGIRQLPSLPFDGKHIINSDHILERDSLPKHMVIVGGGVVGCEMAFIYQSFGVSITLLEGQNRLLPISGIDNEISTLLQREMKKRKINVHLGSTLKNISIENGQVSAQIEPLTIQGQNPNPKAKILPISADVVLVTVGRTPAINGLGLAENSIDCDEHGWIKVDEHLRTSVPNIYAIGDILGPKYIMLAHMAGAEGIHAVRHMLASDKDTMPHMNYSIVPSAIFTTPEVGCVGLSEAQAQEMGIEVKCVTFQMRELGKAQASGHLAGIVKLVADAKNGKLLGAHLAGEHCSDMLAQMTLCMQMGGTIQDISNTIHAHPTMAEGIFEAAAHLYPPQF